jgi:hypothetical protein
MKVPREQLWVDKWVVDFVSSPPNDYASGLASTSRAMNLPATSVFWRGLEGETVENHQHA